MATKGGHTRKGPDWDLDGRPEQFKHACEASLQRLNVDCIDLYQFHRPDPKVPFEESVGALRELRHQGKVRHVGISNVDCRQIDAARAIVEIASVQNELSPRFPSPLRNGELELCKRHGIAFLPWSPFGGIPRAGGLRHSSTALTASAERHGVSPYRVVLAWLLARSPVMLPIPGASRPESVTDSAAAPSLRLDPAERTALEALSAPPASTRVSQRPVSTMSS